MDSKNLQGAFGLGTLPDLARSLATDNTGCLRMDGLAVFEFAVREVVPRLKSFMNEQNLTNDAISTWLFHQAGGTVLQYMQRALGLDPMRVPSALDGYGNTGSASLGILLSHCFPGDAHPELERTMLVGFGSGFQWGIHLADLSQTRIHTVHELHPDGRLVPLAGKGIENLPPSARYVRGPQLGPAALRSRRAGLFWLGGLHHAHRGRPLSRLSTKLGPGRSPRLGLSAFPFPHLTRHGRLPAGQVE